MIKELRIKNFQSHKESCLHFTSGVNVITGASDSGKTAVLRALLWFVNNRPSGDAIRNWNCSEKDVVSVSLLLDDVVITKNRLGSKSSYIFDNKKYDAIKTDVPEEITKFLNLSELNIQPQHQPYFLLNDSSGEVSRKLNQIVGLNIIDDLFVKINSEVQNVNTQIKMNQSELSLLEHKIEEMRFLDDAVKKFDELEMDVKEYERLLDDIDLLEDKVQAYKQIGLEKRSIESVLKYEESVKQLLEFVGRYDDCVKDSVKLDSLLNKYNSNVTLLSELNNRIKKLQQEHDEIIRSNTICPLLNIKCKELANYDSRKKEVINNW